MTTQQNLAASSASSAPAAAAPSSPATPRDRVRLRAPELTGRRWINTGGDDLSLEDLRGKIVLLDFWTFCCINCLHVLDELRPIEEKYGDVLVTIGVHSPKFEFERTVEAVDRAVERYGVEHIVLDDPDLVTWQAYTARAWPTLTLIDPEGYIVASMSGEGHSAGLASLIEELVEEHAAKGTLHRGDGPYVPPAPVERDLSYPGEVIRLSDIPGHEGNLLVADSGHHSLVEYDPTGTQIIQRIGSGGRGREDGAGDTARFSEPGGMTELPRAVAEQVGYDLVVADTVNHLLRGVRLTGDAPVVTTLAGTGEQFMVGANDNVVGSPGAQAPFEADGPTIRLSSPWDVLWAPATERVIVAMAGNHTIWDFDPATGVIRQLSGTMNEGLRDATAPGEDAWYAQTSGLSLSADGTVWLADSETSALRRLDPRDGTVTTQVGVGLFDFGFQDGPAAEARLQHPLGVAELPDGSVAIADTYNGAIRRYDPVTETVSTLARGLEEPSDILVVLPEHTEGDDAEAAEPHLLIAESAAHRLTAIAIPREALVVAEGAQRTKRPTTTINDASLDLEIGFTVPAGQKLDDRWGDPTHLQVSSTPPELITAGAGGEDGLTRSLTLNPEVSSGVLHITVRAAACDGEPGGEIPLHAACHLYQQDWGIPVVLDPAGESRLQLDLRGTN
ncbi:NHL domain-containing thioredoxin family protein [Brevibacterium senegalense]|uniref:NHL domain-containing thioredoxin family protein n=1 Tax=Brevibacterium senegalense TaxID=1033736 RepID=UPI0003098009|nr:NHL domain-containing thioredoxin family protein [Brevibacterium senegalense]